MTTLAMELLREVSEAGGTVQLEGDALRLSATEPLPDDLRVRLRQHKAEIVALLSATKPVTEAAPTVAVELSSADLPREIADGVGAILSAHRALGLPPQCWPRVQRDAAPLVECGGARQALTLGWTAADLFGCDRRAPWHRLDRAGLVLLLGGHELAELDPRTAAMRTPTGSVLRFRRRPPARSPAALLWELLVFTQVPGPPIRLTTQPRAAMFLARPRRPDQDHPAEEVHGYIDSVRPPQQRGKSKRHITGRGNAGKEAVIAAVRALGFAPADDDEADAQALPDWTLKTGGKR